MRNGQSNQPMSREEFRATFLSLSAEKQDFMISILEALTAERSTETGELQGPLAPPPEEPAQMQEGRDDE